MIEEFVYQMMRWTSQRMILSAVVH